MEIQQKKRKRNECFDDVPRAQRNLIRGLRQQIAELERKEHSLNAHIVKLEGDIGRLRELNGNTIEEFVANTDLWKNNGAMHIRATYVVNGQLTVNNMTIHKFNADNAKKSPAAQASEDYNTSVNISRLGARIHDLLIRPRGRAWPRHRSDVDNVSVSNLGEFQAALLDRKTLADPVLDLLYAIFTGQHGRPEKLKFQEVPTVGRRQGMASFLSYCLLLNVVHPPNRWYTALQLRP